MKKALYLLIVILLIAVPNFIVAQNMALNFDGTDDYVDCGNDASLQISGSITLEAWIYPTAFGANVYDNTIISKEGTGAAFTGYMLRCGGAGILNFAFGNTLTWYELNSPSGALALNTWSHVAGVYNGGTMRIYVNGVSVNYVDLNVTLVKNTTDNLSIGGSITYYPNRQFQGKIDEVSIWNIDIITGVTNNMYKELVGNETGLVAYYNSNATSGTTLGDNTSNANTGTLTNMVGTEWTPSSAFFGPKNSLIFDGTTDQYVNCGTGLSTAIAGTGGFSVEAWIYPTDFKTNVYDNTIAANSSTGNGFILRFGGSGILETALGIGGAWTILTSPNNVLVLNKWQHVAVTYNGANLILYVNGIQVASKAETGSVGNSAEAFAIGESNGFSDRGFVGNIDEVRVWDNARTLTEIRENMNKALSGSETNLVAYYNFDSNNGTSLQDFTTNTNTGTLIHMDGATDWVTSTAFNTWLNTNSTVGGTASNWSNGAIPISTDNVGVYNYTGGSQPTLTTALTCNNLVVGSGATLTLNFSGSHTINGSAFVIGTSNINSGNLLTITKSLYILPSSTLNVNAGGQLTVGTNLEVLSTGNCNIKSDATGTGSLIIVGTATGDVTVERFLTKDVWHYISGQTNITADFTSTMGLTPTAGNDQFYRWDESLVTNTIPGTWVDILNGPTGDGTNTEMGQTFVACKGYATTYITTDKTLSLSGVPYVQNQVIAITKTAGGNTPGANLVGNPFTSTIAVNELAQTTNNFIAQNSAVLDANAQSVYLWDESITDYATISSADNAAYIAPGQGFMVVAKDGGGNLQLNVAIRKHGTATFYKETTDSNNRLELKVVSSQNDINYTKIAFLPDMTLGLDPSYDALKLKGNPNIALYTRLVQDNGVDFAIQALPNNDIENIVIPVGIDVAETIMCEFSVNTEAMEAYPIYLEDTKENIVTNLKEHSYNTLVTESGTGRFFLHFREVSGVDDTENINNIIQIWAVNHTINIYNANNYAGDIKVLNMFGQTILKTQLTGNQTQQIRVNAPSGYYIINTITKKGVVNKKLYLR